MRSGIVHWRADLSPKGNKRGPHAVDDATWQTFIQYGAEHGIIEGGPYPLVQRILVALLEAATDYDALCASLDAPEQDIPSQGRKGASASS